MELSIIIPTYNRGEVYRQTIEAATAAIADLDAEIIVVNDYKKGNPEIPAHPRVRMVNNPKSGVASARNLGASLAMGQLLIFLDDDVLVTAANLQRSLDLFHQHPGWCVNPNWVYPSDLQHRMDQSAFGRYLRYYQFDSLQGWRKGMFWDDRQVFKVDAGASYYLAMPKNIFTATGGYDERFPFSGAEDFEFMERLKQRGIDMMIDPLTLVFHNESDRFDMMQFMARKERNGETRKLAADMGYSQMSITYTPVKQLIYGMLALWPEFPALLLKLLPNSKAFDQVSRKLIDVMHATYLFRGYNKKKSSN
ncbi:MAG: glycosyltransferase [Chitinophagales bacterium]